MDEVSEKNKKTQIEKLETQKKKRDTSTRQGRPRNPKTREEPQKSRKPTPTKQGARKGAGTPSE